MTSTALFLFTLALSDTLILIGTLRDWVLYIWDIDIRMLNSPWCKAHLYLIYCSIHLSSWLMVAVTLERTACVLFPHKVRLMCSPRNAELIIVTIVLAVFGINIIIPVVFDVNGYLGRECTLSAKEYRDLWDYVYQWTDLTFSFGAPFILLLIWNVIIVVQLLRSRSRRQRMSISGQSRDTRQVSMLMIALCVLFVYQLEKIDALKTVDPSTAWYDYQFLLFQATVVNLVGFFNATFYFAIYVFSGSKFRAELNSLLCCKERKDTSLFGS
ncbi:tachykinin-like peptides receptor 86C [Dreissena polymorpha]|nr:tachykinin-like peptides receptor 86C [Dreissena polymorpha]